MPNDVPRRFDKNGDGIDDILFFNRTMPGIQLMTILGNDGAGNFTANWQSDWIGGWNMGSGDNIKVVDFRGDANWDDLFIYNDNWFGLIKGLNGVFNSESIYYRWIQNLRYHSSNLY